MRKNRYQGFNNCLRKYRKARGLKQKEVAEILEINNSMVSRWENGSCIPDSLHLMDLSLLYRTATDALLIDYRAIRKEVIMQREELVLANKN